MFNSITLLLVAISPVVSLGFAYAVFELAKSYNLKQYLFLE